MGQNLRDYRAAELQIRYKAGLQPLARFKNQI
jgi:hypothetical protein